MIKDVFFVKGGSSLEVKFIIWFIFLDFEVLWFMLKIDDELIIYCYGFVWVKDFIWFS